MIEFGSYTCPVFRQSVPRTETLYEKYKDKKFIAYVCSNYYSKDFQKEFAQTLMDLDYRMAWEKRRLRQSLDDMQMLDLRPTESSN